MSTVSLKKSIFSLETLQKEWVFHLLCWILFIASFAIPETWTRIFPDNGISFAILTLIIPFYINASFLIPRYFKRSSWAKYILLLVLLLIVVNMLKALLLTLSLEFKGLEYRFAAEFNKWIFRDFRNLDKFIFSGTALVLYFSFAYRFVKDWIINERVKERLISEKSSMELALLKAQVNPHFLFNTLNNIYAMALEEKAERTAGGVAKMGALMRYSLHDAQADFILLQKELVYIEQYIEMQKLRVSEDRRLRIHLNLADLEIKGEKIAPMILIPFIENAFKYGVSTVRDSLINIKISLSGSYLKMRVQNKVHANIQVDQGGLGLKNVKNRLGLIYPGHHKLDYGIKGDVYIVNLEIDLKE